jgi:hypothetical protein
LAVLGNATQCLASVISSFRFTTIQKIMSDEKIITPEILPSIYNAMQAQIILEVWKDESLRDQIRENPRQTIENILGHPIDSSLKIRIVECQENEVAFALPNFKLEEQGPRELADEQLDAVAGGIDLKNIAGLVGGGSGGGVGDLASLIPGMNNPIVQTILGSVMSAQPFEKPHDSPETAIQKLGGFVSRARQQRGE